MKPLFQGAATALITPMTQSGVDLAALKRLIDWQIEAGISALAVCATTGEAPTLTQEEYKAVVQTTVQQARGRVPVLVGTGSNSTAHGVELTKLAGDLGADGALVVTPYYNKATQEGLVAHYTAIANASTIPVILYNVPGRTGMTIQPETYGRLANVEKIVGIKEASGDLTAIGRTAALTQGKLALYSGNDDQILPILALGGQGVISVLSNVLPAETAELCRRWFAGDTAGAAELQARYQRLIQLLFSQVNPIPVKAALSAMGKCQNILRLPLTPMSPEMAENLIRELRTFLDFSRNPTR